MVAEKFVARTKLIVMILVTAALIRLVFIEADPPRVLADLSGSAGIYFDEGIYAHNARNQVLYGNWISDDFNPLIYNPVLTGIYYLAFKIFGASIVAVKIVSILLGLAALFFFWLVAGAMLKEKEALIVTLLFGTDYLMISYNRLGLLENFNLLFFLVIFYFFLKMREDDRWIYPFAAALTIALLSKYLYLFFFGAAVIALALHCRKSGKWKLLLRFLIVAALLFLCWYLLLFVPFAGQFRSISAGWGGLALPSDFARGWQNLKFTPFFSYFGLNPLLLAGLLLFCSVSLRDIFSPSRFLKWDSGELLVFFWIAGGFLQLGILNYRPLRYYLPLLPAIYLAIAYLLPILREKRRAFAFSTFAWAAIFLVLMGKDLFLGVRKNLATIQVHWGLLAAVLLLSFLSVMLLKRAATPRTLAVFACFSITLSGVVYVKQTVLNRSFNLKLASGYFQSLAGPVTVVGQEALRLNFDTANRAFMAYETWFNSKKPLERFAADYLVVLNKFNNAELGWLLRRHPYYRKWLRFERRFRIWDTTLTVFRVERE